MDQAVTALSLEYSRPESRELNSGNSGGTRSPVGSWLTVSLTAAESPPRNLSNSSEKTKNRTYSEVTEDTSHPLPQTTQSMLMMIHLSRPWETRVAERALPTQSATLIPTAFPKSSPSQVDTRACTGALILIMTYCWCVSGLDLPLRKIATDPVAGMHDSSL